MNTSPAQTTKFADKREALIASASGLLNERGIRGTTLSAVAEGVGLIKNSVTYYFRRKEDLAAACYLRSIDLYNRLTDEAMAQAGMPARLGALLRAHAQVLAAVEQGLHAPVTRFHDLRALRGEHMAPVYAAYEDMFRRLRRLLNDEATADRSAANARTHIVLGVVNAQRVWLLRHEPERFGAVADSMLGLLLRGVMASGARWQAEGCELRWQLGSADLSPSAAFLRTATQLINEQGYRGASVNRIAERLNMTKGGFYYHNETKDDLVACCFDETFAIVRQALAQAEQEQVSGWERLSAVLRALVLFQITPDGSPLLQWSAVPTLPDAAERSRIRQALGRIGERLASLVVGGMVDGSIRPLDPMQAAQLAMVGINAAAELQRFVPGTTPQAAVELYVRPLLMGLE
ncbi:TetR/AcrR family transcriptional regulator [Pseudorhodoferax soli]|uniref:TetR family transcriptional regulator n=1 Tax=Pseudorhodoferax soli TaxID=545864 RepID=A0A368Y186_9BURK|nr:TetR/AcrR family transcriptional regulator [Pseudorhodoferax soli]RCW73962.1 TetR family transcriptional regulator [Pseudorhodoferax soli]